MIYCLKLEAMYTHGKIPFMGPRHKLSVDNIEIWPFSDRMTEKFLRKQEVVPTLVFQDKFGGKTSYWTHTWRHAFEMCFRLWQLHEQVCEWELDGSSPWQINFLKICICKSIEAYISVLCICLSTISFLCDLLNIFYFDVSHAIQTEIVLYCLWYLNNNLRYIKMYMLSSFCFF